MAEPEGSLLKPPWLAVPIDLHVRMVRAGLDAPTRDLCFGAWCYVALHRTDGRLARAEADHLIGSTPGRRSDLVRAGFWRTAEGRGYEVVGYLDGGLNRTSAEIERLRAGGRARQSRYTKKPATQAATKR
jgi:hypothetical protein